MSKRRARKVQYAVLPFRPGLHGLEILMVTSRETRRWVIPKGWPMKQKAPHEAAAIEAWEEAGVEGHVAENPIGSYGYGKRLKTGQIKPCEVVVFPFRVDVEHPEWLEAHQRERRWFSPEEAAMRVDEPGLAALIVAFARVPLDAIDRGANPEG